MVCKEYWWSNSCNTKDDIRYDDTVSADISALDPLFSKLEGFWTGTVNTFDESYTPVVPEFGIPGVFPNGPFPYDRVSTAFYNITMDGTRWEQHDIYVHKPADSSFCDQFVPPGLLNVGDDGVCGVNGFVRAGDAFKAATFEKEDRLVGVSGTGAYLIQVDDPSDFEQNLIIGGGNQIVESNYYGTGMNSYTMTLSEDANSVIWQMSIYSINATDTFLRATNVISMERVDTADEWTQMLNNAMDEANIMPATRTGTFNLDNEQCVVEDDFCPTTDMWCAQGDAHPDCGASPYVEETTVNGGVVGGVAAAVGIVLIAAVFFIMKSIQKRKLAEQNERIKNGFAARIIENLGIGQGSSADAFTQEAISAEFARADVGVDGAGANDGQLSKDELREFMTSGKVGKMSDGDFEALFAMMDEDGSGDISFAEFAAFMSLISENMKKFSEEA